MAVPFDRNTALTTLAGFALAAVVAGRLDAASWTDLALPLWVLLATLPAVGLPARTGAQLAFTVPVLLAIAIMVPAAPLRHLGYGAVIGAAFLIGIAATTASGRIPLRYSIRLVVIAASARLFPFDGRAAAGLLVVLVGTLLVVRWSSEPAETPASETARDRAPRSAAVPLVFLCLALVLVAPIAPLRAALFVPAFAAAMLFLLEGSIVAVAVAVLLAIFVGKWAIAAVAIVGIARFAGSWIRVREGSSAVAFPTWGSLRAASGALVFWPGAPLAFGRASVPERVAVAGLLALSILARPAPAMLLALSAVILLGRRAGDAGTRLSIVTGGFAFALLALLPTSGAIGPAFPTLLDWPLALVLVVSASVALFLPPRIGAVLAAAIPIVILAAVDLGPRHVQPVGQSAGAGARLVLAPPFATERIQLAISAVNASGLRDGVVVGALYVMDREGNAWKREIRIGEIADWAAFREGDFFRTLNRRPSQPGGVVVGAGRESFLRGEGMIPIRIPAAIRRIELAVAEDLPREVRLHLDRIEVPSR